MGSKSNERQYDLDWIRVIAILGVFLYHSSMFFNPFPWHVKNNIIESSWILVFSLFVGIWIMPIFFAISGMNTIHSLRKRSSLQFIKERLKRLGLPLLFGIFILSPPQVYIERVTNLGFSGSFLEFIPYYFDGLYLDIGGKGNFAFSGLHLWYLLVLLVFSFISLPLFKRIPVSDKLNKVHFILLPLVLFLTGILHIMSLGGWDLVFYFMTFLYGYYFFSASNFRSTLRSIYKITILVAVIATIIYIAGFPHPDFMPEYLFYGIKVLACWGWLLIIFYLADRYLAFANDFLNYTSEASMPFYVLHQPIIVFVGYTIRDFSWSIPLKLIFLVTVSFVIIMSLYHFLIRKISILRILFGLKG
ncbi:acyltransferase [Lysinibacillus yapensis]|uniref:Acyltransferase n=1 Tax=Ureibacillus yapensis TaxID=2304605 RepID=A0A396S4E4_9BACL|nr:acyltransferase family protein [Lysinibacillus yapensis]RHW32390.1 acyltransferase [Lysinibacillus yapensis]